MTTTRYKRCRQCGASSEDVGELSWSQLCPTCGIDNFTENLAGLITHSGPRFQHWRQRLAASVGAVPLDSAPSSPHTRS